MDEDQEVKKIDATRDNVAEWLRHDLEKIVALCNIMRMNPNVFEAMVTIIHDRIKLQDHEKAPKQPSLFDEQETVV